MRAALTFARPTRSYASGPVGDLTGPARGEAGVDGESWYAQVLGGGPDVNPELTGSQKFLVYDEMAKTDAAVKSLLMFWMLPVKSAVWGLNPASEDPVDRLIRDACEAQFGVEEDDGWLDLSWKELLAQGMREILTMGPCIEELVWDDAREWLDGDGDPHLIRPLARVALRPAHTISKVAFDRGRVKSVEQLLSGTKTMPGDKVSYMVFERESSRWDGVSALRSAWGPWTLKKALMIAAGIGWDRFASGLPVVWHPNDPDSEEKAKQIGRSIRQHERAYAHFPTDGPALNGGRPESAWFLELLNGAQTLADPTPLLKFFNDEIAEVGMQTFKRQGMGTTGARATSETQIDPYFLAVQQLADYMRRERRRQVMRRFVEVNFGPAAAERGMPKLTVTKVQIRSIQVIANAISVLAAAGFKLDDRETQDDVRELLGFGKLADAADTMGVSVPQLEAALRAAGVDAATLAGIVNALPEGFGVSRNTVPPPEGQLAAG